MPIATADLKNVLNFLKTQNDQYSLNLESIIVAGFSAGGHIATDVGFKKNNPEFPKTLDRDIKIVGVINFSGSVDTQGVIERTFIDSNIEIPNKLGRALFPCEGYET